MTYKNNNIKSKTFPYIKVYPQNNDFANITPLTYNILTYLMDMPMPHIGYEPIDDNEYPRTRLIKYIYYDDNKPLSHSLPTPTEKISIKYNPEKTSSVEVPEKGYRLFLQSQWRELQTKGQTTLSITLGQGSRSNSNDKTIRQIIFTVLTNMQYENNIGSTTRSWQIVQAIVESLNGVNMPGLIGGFEFVRDYEITDNNSNVGRVLIMQAEIGNKYETMGC